MGEPKKNKAVYRLNHSICQSLSAPKSRCPFPDRRMPASLHVQQTFYYHSTASSPRQQHHHHHHRHCRPPVTSAPGGWWREFVGAIFFGNPGADLSGEISNCLPFLVSCWLSVCLSDYKCVSGGGTSHLLYGKYLRNFHHCIIIVGNERVSLGEDN